LISRNAKGHPEYNTVKQLMEESLGRYENSDDQGSMRWRIKRAVNSTPDKIHMVLGGSELAGALFRGLDHFTDESQLLERKAEFLTRGRDPEPEPGAKITITEWGHVTEPVLRAYTAHYFGTECWTMETSVVHPTVPNFRYSPDGFALLTVDGRLCRVLLEHKNPWRRVVVTDLPDSDMPEQYKPQVYGGLDVFRWCDFALFTEANFCAVQMYNWGKPLYNAMIHEYGGPSGKRGKEKFDGLKLLDSCMIGFYAADLSTWEARRAEEARNLLADTRMALITSGTCWNDDYCVLDIGSMGSSWFESIMRMHADKILVSRHSGFMRADGLSQAAAMEDLCGGEQPFGVLTINMFKFGWCVKERKKFYIELLEPKIKAFCAKLEALVEEKGGLHASFRGKSDVV
jgi:hypothetical protein